MLQSLSSLDESVALEMGSSSSSELSELEESELELSELDSSDLGLFLEDNLARLLALILAVAAAIWKA